VFWLNYHHLLYFNTVATEGSIVRASEVLRLSPSTISVQIKELEKSLGEDLFERKGRQLVLTEAGRVAQTYADEIFALGREMVDTLQSGLSHRPMRLAVGISDVLPKLIVHRLLQPVFGYEHPVHLMCEEGEVEELLGKLSLHELDVVLTEAPMAPNVPIQAFNHLLGQSEVGVFGAPELVEKYGSDFPKSLEGAPFMMPTTRTVLRRALNGWFDRMGVRIHEIAEIDDRALMMVFAMESEGFFAAPMVMEQELKRRFHVENVGVMEGVRERFYAVTLERRIRHPVVDALSRNARRELADEINDEEE